MSGSHLQPVAVEHSMFTNVKYIYLRYFFSKSVALLKISFYFCKNIYKNICKSRKIFSTTTKKQEKIMVTRKEYMTQMERLRNERSEEICKQFLTLKEENAGFKPWRIIGIIARELEVSTQTVFNTLKAKGVYVSKGV